METEKKDLYLVPYDFSSATEDALHFSLKLAQIGGGEVMIVHIAKDRDEITNAEEKLRWLIKHLPEEEKKIISHKVMVGNIFDDIDKIGDLTGATFIVMGTHGATGLQKIFGSSALKVVSNSNTPFIITQEGQNCDKIENIVMPFSFDRESLQVTQIMATLAHKYDAKIHLVGFRHKDEWLLRDMKTNQLIVQKYLNKHNVKHDFHILPGKKSYEIELMEYAQKVDADLIAAAYYTKGFKSYLNSFMQIMITNKNKIPVLTINSPEVMTLNTRFSFITT